jgi:hypothetical protein
MCDGLLCTSVTNSNISDVIAQLRKKCLLLVVVKHSLKYQISEKPASPPVLLRCVDMGGKP